MNTEATPKYVGFWMRVVAMLIDSAVVLALLVPILVAIFGWQETFGSKSLDDIDPVTLIVREAITLLLPAIALIVMWRWKSASPGKMVIRARIVDARTGQDPSLGQCIIRYLGYYVSICTCMLGFLWIAFDGRKQGFHDKMAGTLVVYDPPMTKSPSKVPSA